MSQWRRFPFVLMALFALCALTVPSLAWACPMAARGGDVTRICSVTSKQSEAAMPCCAPAPNNAQMPLCKGKCCKLVPQLPTEDSHKNTALPQSNAEFSGLLAQLSQTAHAIALPVLSVAPLNIEPPLSVHWPDDILPLSLAQTTPDALLGRAPPRP